MVLANSPEFVKSDYKSWRGRIENSFNSLAVGMWKANESSAAIDHMRNKVVPVIE